MIAKGYRILFQSNENRIDYGDGCTTLHIYKKCTLSMDELYLYANYIFIQLLPKSKQSKNKPTSKHHGNVFILLYNSAP